MNQQILAYMALFLGILALTFSPIFVSLAQVNGLAATLYRTSIAASALLIPFLLPRDNHLGTATSRPSLMHFKQTSCAKHRHHVARFSHKHLVKDALAVCRRGKFFQTSEVLDDNFAVRSTRKYQ